MSGFLAFVYGEAQHIREKPHEKPNCGGELRAQQQQFFCRGVYVRAAALNLRLRQLRHDELRRSGHDARREEDDRQNHALYRPIACERPVGGVPCGFQPTRDEQVLQHRQRAARVGGHRQRQCNFKHPRRQALSAAALAVVPPPVVDIYRQHQRQRHDIRDNPPERYRRTAQLYILQRGARKAQRHQRDTEKLFRQMHGARLPHTPARREVPRQRRAQRRARHTHRAQPQRAHRARIAYPQKAYRLCQRAEYQPRRHPEKQRVAHAAPHRRAYPRAVERTQFLGDEPRRRKAYAGHRKGHCQPRHRQHQLIKPYARRADPPHEPHLKRNAYTAHQQRHAREQKCVVYQPPFLNHTHTPG